MESFEIVVLPLGQASHQAHCRLYLRLRLAGNEFIKGIPDAAILLCAFSDAYAEYENRKSMYASEEYAGRGAAGPEFYTGLDLTVTNCR